MPCFGTSTNGLSMCVDVYSWLEGNYPNVQMVVSYGMYYTAQYSQNSLTAYSATFTFDGTSHRYDANGRGAGRYPSSGYYASGQKRYSLGNSSSISKDMYCSTAFGNFSAGGTCSASQSISGPSVYQIDKVEEITPFTAKATYRLSNSRNYWRIRIKDTVSGKTWNVSPDNGNGTKVLDGLSPETKYNLKAEVLNRNGEVAYTGNGVEFFTIADQLKLAFNQGNTLKMARVFYNDNGVIKKVKKCFINQNGTIKRMKNYGGA